LAALCCALVSSAAASGTRYEERFEDALQFEQDGEFAAALDTLDDLEEAYPQDYPLMLQLGWLAWNAGALQRAEGYYSQAAELSGGSDESRLGLEGVAASQRMRGSAHASVLGYGYPAIGERTWGLGLMAGGGLTYKQLVGGITYRFGRFSSMMAAPPGPGGPMPQDSASESFSQHELYLTAGGSWSKVGVTGHYSLLTETSGTLGTGHVVGVAARFSPLGRITVEASVSLYDDLNVFRTAVAWQLPLGGGFWIRPGGSLQGVDETILGAGHLDLGYGDDGGEVWLGGKGGSEFRPAYLADSAVYNILETIPWGAHVGGCVLLTDHLSLTGTFEAYGASVTDLGDSGEGTAHVGLVGSIGAAIDF